MTEGEIFERLSNSLKQAADAARMLAFRRQDPHWILVQRGLEASHERVVKLANSRQQPLIHRYLS